MNQRTAKKLRRFVYGPDGATRERHYKIMSNGQVINSDRRLIYKAMKRMKRDRMEPPEHLLIPKAIAKFPDFEPTFHGEHMTNTFIAFRENLLERYEDWLMKKMLPTTATR